MLKLKQEQLTTLLNKLNVPHMEITEGRYLIYPTSSPLSEVLPQSKWIFDPNVGTLLYLDLNEYEFSDYDSYDHIVDQVNKRNTTVS